MLVDKLEPPHLVFLQHMQSVSPFTIRNWVSKGFTRRDLQKLVKRGIIEHRETRLSVKYYGVVDDVFQDR